MTALPEVGSTFLTFYAESTTIYKSAVCIWSFVQPISGTVHRFVIERYDDGRTNRAYIVMAAGQECFRRETTARPEEWIELLQAFAFLTIASVMTAADQAEWTGVFAARLKGSSNDERDHRASEATGPQ